MHPDPWAIYWPFMFCMFGTLFVGVWWFAEMSTYNLELVREIVKVMAVYAVVIALMVWGARELEKNG